MGGDLQAVRASSLAAEECVQFRVIRIGVALLPALAVEKYVEFTVSAHVVAMRRSCLAMPVKSRNQ